SQQTAPAPPAGTRAGPRTGPKPGRRRALAVTGGLGLGVAVLAFFVLQRHLTPNYWTADNLGPVPVNPAPRPGPTPQRLAWGRHLLEGARGVRRRQAGPQGLRGRLPDGPDRRPQRPVRRLRQGHRPRHRRRTPAGPQEAAGVPGGGVRLPARLPGLPGRGARRRAGRAVLGGAVP